MTRRQVNGLCALLSGVLVVASFYWQYVAQLAPCPLCFIQRWIMMALVVWFTLGAWLTRRALVFVNQCLIGLTALLGTLIAVRHSWLQVSTDDGPTACLPDLGYMLEFLPASETFQLLFSHAGGCGQVEWDFLFLTMPMWLIGFFAGFLLVGLWGFWRLPSAKQSFGLFIK
jgi:disulfide bond formation protein DsbB